MGDVRRGDPQASDSMSERAEPERRADVVILTALRFEYDAVLQVEADAVQGSTWEHATGPNGLPLAFRSFGVPTPSRTRSTSSSGSARDYGTPTPPSTLPRSVTADPRVRA